LLFTDAFAMGGHWPALWASASMVALLDLDILLLWFWCLCYGKINSLLNEAKISRPKPRPRSGSWGRDRVQDFEVKTEAEANLLRSRPKPRPKIKVWIKSIKWWLTA